MTSQLDINQTLFERAASMYRVHGIIAIIFGGLGVLGGALITFILIVATMLPEYEVQNVENDLGFGLFMSAVLIFIFWTLPHLYLVVSGVYLVKNPSPLLAKGLIIANLVVGLFYNVIILVFAIISLTQSGDYERGYSVHQKELAKK